MSRQTGFVRAGWLAMGGYLVTGGISGRVEGDSVREILVVIIGAQTECMTHSCE